MLMKTPYKGLFRWASGNGVGNQVAKKGENGPNLLTCEAVIRIATTENRGESIFWYQHLVTEAWHLNSRNLGLYGQCHWFQLLLLQPTLPRQVTRRLLNPLQRGESWAMHWQREGCNSKYMKTNLNTWIIEFHTGLSHVPSFLLATNHCSAPADPNSGSQLLQLSYCPNGRTKVESFKMGMV